ncbi:MAG: type I DNA topoisomerase [Christensenellaceae bacterium]|nr:type I DNA topoisomerase [Christensenellaceae bacterium]
MATGKNLVIVESPAKAKTLSRMLGRNYTVKASQGHVRDLPKSQLGIDTEDDFNIKYITIRGKGEILAELRKEAKKAKKIFLATDPDREGEAISWHLANALNMDEDCTCRVTFNEITKKAVSQAIKNPQKIDMNLVDAQQARRALDRLVGYKISPLLWEKVRKGLSAGRVQSVAARIIVDREQEIEGFIPEEYWDIYAYLDLKNDKGKKQEYRAKLSNLDGEKAKITGADEANSAKKRIEDAKFTASSVKLRERKKSPAAPFTTSTMQQEASRKLNFTIARTMRVAQQLYEGVDLKPGGLQGLVTYIRTDSVRISDEAVDSVRQYILEQYGKEYLPETKNIYKGRAGAQDAHEAIRPTDINRTPESLKDALTREQLQLYTLIHNRFVASQMEQARFDTMTAILEDEKKAIQLRYYGEAKVFAGFTKIYEEGKDDEQEEKQAPLPKLATGDKVKIINADAEQNFTQPPPRFTEASLVRTLEENGIGRPSTYAPTINTLTQRGYVSRENKRLYPTELGELIVDIMKQYFSSIVDIDFTASMETELDKVEEGTKDWKELLREFYPPFEDMLNTAQSEMEKIEIEDEPSDEICEKCGATMVYKMGRFGKFIACPNFPECRNTKPILKYIDAHCPKCGGKLLEKLSKKKRKFYGCENYPECDFVSWEQPIDDRCHKCDSYMTLKRRKDGTIKICSNETCRHHEPYIEKEEDE